MKAAVCRELGQPLVIKEEPLPRCSVVAGRRSCDRRHFGPEEGTANGQLAASVPDLLILGTTKAGGAFHPELIGREIEGEQGCASLPGCRGLAFEFSEEFVRSHERAGDRLHLEMRDGPGLR